MRTGLTLLGILLLTGPAYAECVTTCAADAPRDDKGCCIGQPKAESKPKTNSLSSGPAPCAKGKERSQYTAGHCCWPNQEWSAQNKKCTGTPTCPEGFVGRDDDCHCPEGKEITEFTAGQCCWPTQEWSAKSSQCTGPPKCPRDFERSGAGCTKIIRGTLTLVTTGGKLCLFTINGRKVRPYPFNSIREELPIGAYTAGCVREGYETMTQEVTLTQEGKTLLFRLR